MRGRFISLEGGEGSGKSTQAKLLGDRLKSFGLGVVLTREPGGSAGAEAIRHVLLSGAVKPLGTNAEAILFAAARDDHLREVIRPALESGHWVVCDRFYDSTRIYQGVLGNVDPRLIQSLERLVVGETNPDLTFILDLPAEEGLLRISRRLKGPERDRYESEALEFHKKLREAYRELAAREPERCIIIDATPLSKAVAESIWTIVSQRLEPHAAPLILGA
jgi:dTMP kinase